MDDSDRKVILLVEDEAFIALSEKKSLESYGYRVIIASSGESAIEFAGREGGIDLILMDIDLGRGIDGTEAAGRILESHDIPIVFLSSHSEREVVEKTEKISSYGYVLKNSSITVLDASIKMAFKLFDAFRKERLKEAALAKSERLFAAIFDANPMSMQILDKDGCTLKTNPAFSRLFGSVPPAGYSLFDDAQLARPGTREIVEHLRSGKNIRFPEAYFNAHDSLPDLPDVPVLVRTVGFPLQGSQGSPDEYVLMHENVATTQQAEEERKKRLMEVNFLAQTATEYMKLAPDADIYDFAAKKLSVLLPGYRILISEYSEVEDTATVMAMEGGDDILASVIRILGKGVKGLKSPIPPGEKARLKGERIVTGPKGVYDLAGGAIPEAVARIIDRLLNIGQIYGMGLSSEDSLLGNVVLISPRGVVLEDRAIIESFIGQTSVAVQRRMAEARIKALLKEKTTLLNEVHHRIKNNIASIESLLTLQLDTLKSPEAASALQDAIGRVGSMRILYEKLLYSDDYREISVRGFLESLIDTVLALFPGKARIACERDIEDFQLSPKTLSSLGIVVNEILTNIMKHAFEGKESGLIRISLTKVGRHVTLSIQDDGKGFPGDFNSGESAGFGLMIVRMLSEQMKGSFSMTGHEGTRSTLEFDK